jgi:RNA polymerase sigma-70 factor (ECF subfamily)
MLAAMDNIAQALPAAELANQRPQLMKFALMHLRNRVHAEDAVQDTLLAALDGAAAFAGESSLRTWLMGILKHKITDHFRRQSREAAVDGWDEEGTENLDRLFLEDGHFRNPPDNWGEPEAALSQRQFLEALERGLEQLPPKTARVFRMREAMGLSTEEICKTLGISPSNCWIMLYRARMSLRQYLESHWFSHERDLPPAARGSR